MKHSFCAFIFTFKSCHFTNHIHMHTKINETNHVGPILKLNNWLLVSWLGFITGFVSLCLGEAVGLQDASLQKSAWLFSDTPSSLCHMPHMTDEDETTESDGTNVRHPSPSPSALEAWTHRAACTGASLFHPSYSIESCTLSVCCCCCCSNFLAEGKREKSCIKHVFFSIKTDRQTTL